MSKKEKSIELLNKAVNDELLAVHQYMYFHFLFHIISGLDPPDGFYGAGS